MEKKNLAVTNVLIVYYTVLLIQMDFECGMHGTGGCGNTWGRSCQTEDVSQMIRQIQIDSKNHDNTHNVHLKKTDGRLKNSILLFESM